MPPVPHRRVLTVLNYYHPYVSGLSEYARLVAEGLAARGFHLTVLTGRHDPALPARESLCGVDIIRANPLFFLHKGYLSPALFRLISPELSRAYALHLHLPMLEAGPLALFARLRRPILSTYHCDVARSSASSLLDSAAVSAVRLSARACLRLSRHIVVSSADYARGSRLLRPHQSRWVEIPPPDKGPLAPSAAHRNGHLHVGFLGRFVEEKGIDTLLDAIPHVLQRLPEVRFHLAGELASVAGSSHYHHLHQRLHTLRHAIQLHGRIPEPDLHAFYGSLDAFVLPSINSYEAFGMVQVEAMKAGIPVVASDRRGVRVPVSTTGNGLLVTPGSSQALADALVHVLTHPDFRDRHAIAHRARQAFSTDRVIDSYAELFHSLD